MSKIVALKGEKDFSPLFRYGKRINSASFQIVFQLTNLPYSRIAVVIAKAVSGKSVVRNRIRRRIREWFRTKAINMHTSADVVFVVNKTAVTITRKQLYEELERVFKKI